jgi:DNA recombination protein RmuC
MSEFGQSQTAKLDVFSVQLRATAEEMGRKLDSSRETVDEVLRSLAADTRKLHTEFRSEVTNSLESLARTLDLKASDGMNNQKIQLESSSAAVTLALATSSRSSSEAIEQLRSAVEGRLVAIQNDNSVKLELIRNNVERKLSDATINLTNAIDILSRKTTEAAEGLKSGVESRLSAIQNDNTLKLEEMRRTVDEKLHSTLEQRLGESFRIVSERLEQVHAGLGEMRTLASGVGDLKKSC